MACGSFSHKAVPENTVVFRTADGGALVLGRLNFRFDGTPKAAKDIWNVLSKAGVARYAELVCFSDDPGEAAVNYFILKLMGYTDVKVLLK